MGRKIFLSILGTSAYYPTVYAFPRKDNSWRELGKTEFVQKAIVEYYHNNNEDVFDNITILTTEKAEKENWEDTVRTRRGLKFSLTRMGLPSEDVEKYTSLLEKAGLPLEVIDDYSDGTTTAGLQNQLKHLVREKTVIENVHIGIGQTRAELDEIFETVYQQLKTDDEVIFDITHSMRHMPLLVFTVLNYAKVTKNITIKGVLYGAYEAQIEGINAKPVYDLSYLADLLTITNATEAFVKYGSAKPLTDSYSKISGVMRDTEIESVYKALNQFTTAISVNRGALHYSSGRIVNRSDQSIHEAYQNVESIIQKLGDRFLEQEKYFMPLIEVIQNRLQNFDYQPKALEPQQINDEVHFHMSMKALKWNIDHGFIVQAYNVFYEAIITYLIWKYFPRKTNTFTGETEYYSHLISHRIFIKEKVLDILVNSRYRDKLQALNKIVTEGNQAIEDVLEPRTIANSFANNRQVITNIIKISKEITKDRNDISHFGLTKSISSYDNYQARITRYYDAFVSLIVQDSQTG